MKTLLFILVCTVLLLSGESLFAQELEQEKFEPVDAAVLENEVNIRAGQGLNFELLGQLNKGVRVVVIGQEYDWYKIKLPREALCFVHQDYIDRGVVTAKRLRVRAGGGTNFNVLGILKKEETVNILEQDGDWLRIIPPKDCAGWIKKDYLKLSKRKITPVKIKPAVSLQKEKIKARGIINDLGKIINRQGTHKLTDGKRILYYLNSKNLNLNHYVYQNVCVIGELIDTEDAPYPVINVDQIKVGP